MKLSKNDYWLTGACGGLAEYLGVPSALPRLIFLVAFLFYGTGILLYLVLWAVMALNK